MKACTCPAQDVPDAPKDSPNTSKNGTQSASPQPSEDGLIVLLQALTHNTYAQLELANAIRELIQHGVDQSQEPEDDMPSVGLDGLPIPKN
jgi:hypothetical protein